MLKLSAANNGAKLETGRYGKQRSTQINLPFHSFGGQIEREGVLLLNTDTEQTDYHILATFV